MYCVQDFFFFFVFAMLCLPARPCQIIKGNALHVATIQHPFLPFQSPTHPRLSFLRHCHSVSLFVSLVCVLVRAKTLKHHRRDGVERGQPGHSLAAESWVMKDEGDGEV